MVKTLRVNQAVIAATILCVITVVTWHTSEMIRRVTHSSENAVHYEPTGPVPSGAHSSVVRPKNGTIPKGNQTKFQTVLDQQSDPGIIPKENQTRFNAVLFGPSDPGVVPIRACPEHYHWNMKKYSTYGRIRQEGVIPSANTRDDYNILILTPISDSAYKLHQYFTLLCSLTYPHSRVSIGLGEDSSQDNTYQLALELARGVSDSFMDISVFKLPSRSERWLPEEEHDVFRQFERRRHLARSRNELLMRAIKEEHDWVLWIDDDVAYYPPDIIQMLLSPNKDIVVPVCLAKKPGTSFFSVYDKNTWRETNKSRKYIADRSRDDANFLMLEGYGPNRRLFLSDLRAEGRVVPIDGVGGCTLFVNASCHRQGLIFPPFVFDHHIETEGLGKMASKMNIKMYGLPFVSVIHD